MNPVVKFLVSILIIMVLLISPFFISPIINNIILSSFQRQLLKCPLPEKTTFVEKQAVCGKLNGNGNGMDYFACILIKSDLTLDDLKEYYGNKVFKDAKGKSKHPVTAEVVPANGYKLGSEYVLHQDVYFSSLKNASDYSGYYVVMIYDGGYSSGFDIRGH